MGHERLVRRTERMRMMCRSFACIDMFSETKGRGLAATFAHMGGPEPSETCRTRCLGSDGAVRRRRDWPARVGRRAWSPPRLARRHPRSKRSGGRGGARRLRQNEARQVRRGGAGPGPGPGTSRVESVRGVRRGSRPVRMAPTPQAEPKAYPAFSGGAGTEDMGEGQAK